MPKAIVEFTDGSVNEFYSGDKAGLYSYIRKLKNVRGWEILDVKHDPDTPHYGRDTSGRLRWPIQAQAQAS